MEADVEAEAHRGHEYDHRHHDGGDVPQLISHVAAAEEEHIAARRIQSRQRGRRARHQQRTRRRAAAEAQGVARGQLDFEWDSPSHLAGRGGSSAAAAARIQSRQRGRAGAAAQRRTEGHRR
jgi:hypothetical protein